jgi:ABC-type amino acid transport substrate-binding protein
MTTSGNVDCAVFERMSYNYMVNKHTKTAKDSGSMPYIAMTFKKENAFVGFNTKAGDEELISDYKARFNAVLQSMQENGELDDLVSN